MENAVHFVFVTIIGREANAEWRGKELETCEIRALHKTHTRISPHFTIFGHQLVVTALAGVLCIVPTVYASDGVIHSNYFEATSIEHKSPQIELLN